MATKGYIFEKCFVSWSQYRLFLLEALYSIAMWLEGQMLLTIKMDVISKLAEVISLGS